MELAAAVVVPRRADGLGSEHQFWVESADYPAYQVS